MIVLGIDPGLATVGFGIIEVNAKTVKPVSYGCIRTEPDQPMDSRLLTIFNEMDELFEKYNPDCAAIEKLFFARNVTSALYVSEARGVLRLLAAQHKVPMTEYTPNQIKQAITGSGKADKRQMQDMIARLLGLEDIPKPDDAADGLCAALCHINTVGSMGYK
ncbi:MAG: crossover junction endodeoxyribonuclease RuvC [Methanosarcinales archaeon]|nr:crossover junction endodeoxyribonuclease RuvC [Methanosarcinales archaeon]